MIQHTHLCTHRQLYILIADDPNVSDEQNRIEVIAYGHFVETQSSKLEVFAGYLPEWSQGAEWTKFPSVLISDVA
jgi:hypothetical protein